MVVFQMFFKEIVNHFLKNIIVYLKEVQIYIYEN